MNNKKKSKTYLQNSHINAKKYSIDDDLNVQNLMRSNTADFN